MAKLLYQSPCGMATIWHGDCQSVKIPADAVVVTDPPYNIGKPQLIGDWNGQKTIGQDFGKDFDTAAPLPKEWVPHMPNTVVAFYGAKRMGVLLRTFHRNGFEVVQDFHWCKSNAPMPLRAVGFAWSTESGYIFRRVGTKHPVNKKSGYAKNFIVQAVCSGKERKKHSTQKPLPVMKWLIFHLSLKETLIVDPFMGSGTTGVAALQLGRKFLGIEPKLEYCQLAVKRIKSAVQNYQKSMKLFR